MKGRIVSLSTSLLLVIVFAMCAIFEHHHHAADGSVCLCMHLDCHGHSNDAHHHRSCSHDHDEESNCSGCGIHIDEFCCKDNLRIKVFAGDFTLDCVFVCPIEIGEVSTSQLCEYIVFDAPKQKLCDVALSGLRGPPVDVVFLV